MRDASHDPIQLNRQPEEAERFGAAGQELAAPAIENAVRAVEGEAGEEEGQAMKINARKVER